MANEKEPMAVVDLLHDALVAHTIESTIDSGGVRVAGGANLVLEPRIFDGPANERSKIVQLDIVAHSPQVAPRFIVESVAGFGSDRPAAERDAFGRFLLGPFHVLLTALADHTCESNPAEWRELRTDTTSWRVCDGPLLMHGSGSASTKYPEFLKQLETLFLASASPDIHWVRVFVASFDRKLAGAEVLLDNEPWAEGAALLKGWDWEFPEEYRSLRHFFIAFPKAH